MHKVSIVTINFNDVVGLEKTLLSVISQTYTNIEYIIIDGGSTDGSAELLKTHMDKITYWVSEKDKGIYHAMNKGIEKATGEYCLFLNSGDYFCDKNVLKSVFNQSYTADIVYGNMMIDWGNGNIRLGEMPNKITFPQMYFDTLWHPVSFIKRQLFDLYGKYNESFKIVADYDFFFNTIIMHQVNTQHIEIPICIFNVNGLSSKPENITLVQEERKRVLLAYLPTTVVEFIIENTKSEKKNLNLLNRFINKLKK